MAKCNQCGDKIGIVKWILQGVCDKCKRKNDFFERVGRA